MTNNFLEQDKPIQDTPINVDASSKEDQKNEKANTVIFFSGAGGTHISNYELTKKLKEIYQDVQVFSSVISNEKLEKERDLILAEKILEKVKNGEKVDIKVHSFGVQEFHSFFQVLLDLAEKNSLKEKIFDNVELDLISPYGLGKGVNDLIKNFYRVFKLGFTQAPIGMYTKDLLMPHHEHGITSLSFLPVKGINQELLQNTIKKFIPNYFGHKPTEGMKVISPSLDTENSISSKMSAEQQQEMYRKLAYIDLIITRVITRLSSDTLSPKEIKRDIELLKRQLRKRANALRQEMDAAFTGKNPELFQREIDPNVEHHSGGLPEKSVLKNLLRTFLIKGISGEVIDDLKIWRKNGLKITAKILEYDVIYSMEELMSHLNLSEEEALELITYCSLNTHASFGVNNSAVI